MAEHPYTVQARLKAERLAREAGEAPPKAPAAAPAPPPPPTAPKPVVNPLEEKLEALPDEDLEELVEHHGGGDMLDDMAREDMIAFLIAKDIKL